ncbi:MAG: Xylose isomerase protein barrel [Defluviitaleaceae bacterium]|jgi:sugar phosphate isomerase/epimerase|nr:Xylose isomerase protein barrel [Defluviitaleaceae bacterium]
MKVKGFGINADSGRIDGNLGIFKSDLKFFSEVGYDYVEIPVHGLDLIINGKLNTSQLKKVKNILNYFNLKFTVHAPDRLNLMSEIRGEKHREALKSTIQFAGEIGSETVVYHSSKAYFNEDALNGYYYPKYGRKSKEEIFDMLVEQEIIFMQEVADYARELGVTITVENNWVDNVEVEYTYGIYSETLVEYVKRINKENVGIIYDFGHGYIASKKFNFNFLDSVKCVEPYLKHVHVHDNFGFTDRRERNIDRIPFGYGDLHMPVGWGEIPYNETFKIIDNYSGVFTMELQPRFFEYFREALETVKRMVKIQQNK